jgi:hypothetical protein
MTQLDAGPIDLAGFGYSTGMTTLGQRMELTPQSAYDFWLLCWTYTGDPYPAPARLSVVGASDWTVIDTPPGGTSRDRRHPDRFVAHLRVLREAAYRRHGGYALPRGSTGWLRRRLRFMIQPVPEPDGVVAAAALLLETFTYRRRIA